MSIDSSGSDNRDLDPDLDPDLNLNSTDQISQIADQVTAEIADQVIAGITPNLIDQLDSNDTNNCKIEHSVRCLTKLLETLKTKEITAEIEAEAKKDLFKNWRRIESKYGNVISVFLKILHESEVQTDPENSDNKILVNENGFNETDCGKELLVLAEIIDILYKDKGTDPYARFKPAMRDLHDFQAEKREQSLMEKIKSLDETNEWEKNQWLESELNITYTQEIKQTALSSYNGNDPLILEAKKCFSGQVLDTEAKRLFKQNIGEFGQCILMPNQKTNTIFICAKKDSTPFPYEEVNLIEDFFCKNKEIPHKEDGEIDLSELLNPRNMQSIVLSAEEAKKIPTATIDEIYASTIGVPITLHPYELLIIFSEQTQIIRDQNGEFISYEGSILGSTALNEVTPDSSTFSFTGFDRNNQNSTKDAISELGGDINSCVEAGTFAATPDKHAKFSVLLKIFIEIYRKFKKEEKDLVMATHQRVIKMLKMFLYENGVLEIDENKQFRTKTPEENESWIIGLIKNEARYQKIFDNLINKSIHPILIKIKEAGKNLEALLIKLNWQG